MTSGILQVIGQLVMLGAGIVAGYAIKTLLHRKDLSRAEELGRNAEVEAENILKEARIRAKEEVLKSKDEFERSTQQRRNELQKLEDRLSGREGNIERKADLLEARQEEIEKREKETKRVQEELEEKLKSVEEIKLEQLRELERVSGMSLDEAKRRLLAQLEESLETERAGLIRRYQEENRQRLVEEAQEIMINAMQRYSGDCAYDRTTSTIPLPNEEMKGRIIGREGRNIRTIEAATGANVLIDDTPEAVVVSCFDPVRREIARQSMERLVSDGRIHPTRIEEMVAKVTKEIDAEIQKAGQAVIEEVGLTRVRQNIIDLLGRLKFRYSYSQNVLRHAVEVASMMGNIAAQLGLDERKAKRAGLLHDIGKAVDHELEGSHALIGADILKRAGEDDEVINAVSAHHEEVEKRTPLAVLLEICDTLSASRPGARSETTELYLKRLEQLETIGSSFEGVESCFAIQAGRELRIIVEPSKVSEDYASILAREMAERIEKEMRYPGQIKVSIIRETRTVEYAK